MYTARHSSSLDFVLTRGIPQYSILRNNLKTSFTLTEKQNKNSYYLRKTSTITNKLNKKGRYQGCRTCFLPPPNLCWRRGLTCSAHKCATLVYQS